MYMKKENNKSLAGETVVTRKDQLKERMMKAIYMCYYLCVHEELRGHLANDVDKNKKKIYTNVEIRELLSVNEKLIRKYRDEGLLPYSCVGKKYTYTVDDIQTFFKRTHLRNY